MAYVDEEAGGFDPVAVLVAVEMMNFSRGRNGT